MIRGIISDAISIQFSNIDCRLESYSVTAGTPLRGVVSKDPKVGHTIHCQVLGQEEIKVGKKRWRRQFYQASVSIPHQSTNTSGKYPFRFDLPPSLPQSMKIGNPIGTSGVNIVYTIQIQVAWKKQQQPFHVCSAPLPDTRVPFILSPRDFPVKRGILQSHAGAFTVGARVPDTHVGRGQVFHVFLACQNPIANIEIERVEVKLREVRVCKEQGAEHGPEVEQKKTLWHEQDIQQSIPGLVRRRADTADQAARELLQDLESSSNCFSIHIPHLALDTFMGILVRVEHHIKVTLKTAWLIENPSFQIPVRIGSPPIVSSGPTSGGETDQVVQAIPVPMASGSQGHNVESLPSPTPMVTTVPIVSAVPINARNNDMNEVIQLGGTAVIETNAETDDDFGDLAALVPVPPPTMPTLDTLLQDMVRSINDVKIIQSKLQDSRWVESVLSRLTVEEYGSVIAHVNVDFDQATVAQLLAPVVAQFTCDYCVAALANSCEWNRPNTVGRLLPYCSDVRGRYYIIQQQLTDWERTVTANDFARVLQP